MTGTETPRRPAATGLLGGWISRLDLALELGVTVETLRRWEAIRFGPRQLTPPPFCVIRCGRVGETKGGSHDESNVSLYMRLRLPFACDEISRRNPDSCAPPANKNLKLGKPFVNLSEGRTCAMKIAKLSIRRLFPNRNSSHIARKK